GNAGEWGATSKQLRGRPGRAVLQSPRASHAVVGRPFRAVIALASALVVSGLPVPIHAAPPEDQQAPAKEPAFKTDVEPIFEKHCLRCHDARAKKGGLDLSTPEGALTGGESGPAIVPRQPAASKLYDAIDNGDMPHDRKTQVSAAELETLRLWIEKLGA